MSACQSPERGLNQHPTQYASGYSLDLYCDHWAFGHGHNEFPHTFTGENFAECSRQARAKGWRFHHKTRTATCPKCAESASEKST